MLFVRKQIQIGDGADDLHELGDEEFGEQILS
jgi:hypothetical protein